MSFGLKNENTTFQTFLEKIWGGGFGLFFCLFGRYFYQRRVAGVSSARSFRTFQSERVVLTSARASSSSRSLTSSAMASAEAASIPKNLNLEEIQFRNQDPLVEPKLLVDL